MLSRLLVLLVLPSICSAMLVGNYTGYNNEDGSTPDPNTIHLGGVTPPYPNGNMSSGPLRMMGGDMTVPPPDTTICDILMNAPEPPPITQIPYFCFCMHCKGSSGPKGDTGDRGPPGTPGSPGLRGLMGFKGNRGFTGTQGMKGQKGDLGEKGQQGEAGLVGMKGQQGFKGEKGDSGLEGPAGAQGPPGETGTCPDSCETIPGPPGPQGVPGPAGTRGLPGVQGPMGLRGFKGDKGDMGVPGVAGVDGQKGDQGLQGECECTDGTDGTDGAKGEKGMKGNKGDAGAKGDLGPMGLKGNMGNMGLIGPPGVPGPCTPAIQSAFSAGSNQSFPAMNTPVPFPVIFYNRQMHYNPNGIYTVPVNGTYVFTFNLAVASRTLKVGLFVNFFPIMKTTEAGEMSTISQTIVLHLNRGDRVWLQVKDQSTNGMISGAEITSSFSGYLLFPDSCDIPLGRHHQPDHIVGDYTWDPSTTPSPKTPPPTTTSHP